MILGGGEVLFETKKKFTESLTLCPKRFTRPIILTLFIVPLVWPERLPKQKVAQNVSAFPVHHEGS